MANKHETAEQKLLKMIETSSGGEVSNLKEKKSGGKDRGSVSLLKLINRILMVGILVAGFFMLQAVQSGNALMSEQLDFSQVGGAKGAGNEPMVPTIQKLSYYTAPLDRRNLFEPYSPKAQQTATAVTEEARSAAQKVSHLKLVGISWLDSIESASVMLEDTQKETTYFLQKDDKLGEVNIKTIYADSVELGFGNEEIMIHYDIPQQ